MFLARTPAKKTPANLNVSPSGIAHPTQTDTGALPSPPPNAPTKASSVRRSIGEWENGKLAESQPPSPAAAYSSQRSAPITTVASKNPRGAAAQPDSRAVTRRTSTEAAKTPPGPIKLQQQKSSDRVTEARNCLTRAKTLLGESRNLRTDIKVGITQSVDRLYQLVKEEAAAAARTKGVTAGKEEEAETVNKDTSIKENETKMNKLLEEHTKLLKEHKKEMEDLKKTLHKAEEKMREETEDREKKANKHLEEIGKMTEEITKQNEERRTYAGVLAGPPRGGAVGMTTTHSVVVTSRDEMDTGEQVLEKIRTAVNAKEGGIMIERIRKGKDRKIIIGCETKEELGRVKARIETANANLTIEEVANKDPLLVLKGVLSVHSDEELLGALRNQNRELFKDLEKENDRVVVRYRKKARNPHTCHVVISTSPAIWQRVTARKEVRIDLQCIRAEDQTPLVQCTRCLGYGHGKRFCTEPTDMCSHCSGPHLKAECADFLAGSQPKCRNCTIAKHDNVVHNTFDSTCPIRRKWDALARSTVAYC